MNAADRTALIALYRSTGGDVWLQNTGWCTDAPVSQWHGVSVNEEGRVVGLDLSSNNLVGEIPRELSSLHNLEKLYLYLNELTGEIPRELGSLHNLKELYLGQNKLTGEIPRELGSLNNLEKLYLQRNKLTGEIPRELSSLHNLEKLYLYLNELTGEIPRELGSVHNLKELKLGLNKLTGEIPRELGSLHNLKELKLGQNELTGEIPRELGSLSNLEKLYLYLNELTGEIPRELGSLHNLEKLHLYLNNLTGEIPRELGSLHNLKELYLQRNKLTGEIPRELGSLHNLEKLYLYRNELTGEIPRELGSLHNLEILGLHGNKLTGAVPAQLVKLYRLRRLGLAGNNFSGSLPSLKQLKDLFEALARTDSGNEERPVYSDTTGLSAKGSTQKAASSANTAATASMTASSLSGKTRLKWQEPKGLTEGQRRGKIRKVTTRVSDFEGDVMAWSFGSTSEVVSGPDFELEIPGLEREVPALIGQSPSEAEMVNGEVCLLHPVVTCLAGNGEIFNPPLLLRFPVGDAMESGSDAGSRNEDEESYKADLWSRFSVVTREEGSSTWVPIDGEIKKMGNGVFVLEAQVSHFTDYALRQAPFSLAWSVDIGQGGVEKITVKKLRNVSLFENKGDRTIMLYYWRHRTWRSWIPRARVSLGVSPVEISGEVDRKILDYSTDVVYSKLVPSDQCEVINNTKSLEVAWATLEARDDHRLVTVWGSSTLYRKEAMRIGPLPERVYADVRDLRIADGEHVGTRVRASLDNR